LSVSTRKVRAVVEELCGTEFSKTTVSALCKGLDDVVKEWNERNSVYSMGLLVAFIILALLLSGLLKWLWNTTMPAIFSLPRLTYWQAFRLIVIA